MRNRFDEQLAGLHKEMIDMGCLCEKAITLAIQALFDKDTTIIEQVFLTDSEIDRKERTIESICMRLLMQQQPVAKDLREISSSLKMISDMERIGDQASDIAEIAKYIIDHQDIQSGDLIRKMSKEAIKMVNESIDSFVKKNLDLARHVIAYDDVVDNLFIQMKDELIKRISENGKAGEYYIDLLMIAKYLERISDHATNIAEWVEYSITGTHVEK